MDKVIILRFIFSFSAMLLLACCGTAEPRKEALSLAIKDRSGAVLDEAVRRLEKEGNGSEKIVGYTTPGMPLRLPGKVIRIYVAPMKSPMGRLIGEHYVWAIVQEETWWTPSETGLDTIAPSDLYRKGVSNEGEE